MTTATRCEITDLWPAECAHCRRIPDPKPRQLGRPFAAVHPGRCSDCGQRFEPGDRIRRVHDDDGTGYLGPCCADDDTR